LRGLHYQIKEPQGKFITPVAGRIFDVAVDLRRSSKNFGKWCGVVLDSRNPASIYVPPKFAHGYLALDAGASVFYLCTTYHDPSTDRTLRWNDPKVGVQWPMGRGANLFMSNKDRNAPGLDEVETFG
jgi:dTDP-4-dehydrorhamnose 3,5-epimerase